MSRLELIVSERYHRKRLGDFIFESFPDHSKMYLRDIIRAGKCEVNGEVKNSGSFLRKNDFIEIELDLHAETSMKPENIPLDIIFEDEDLLAVNKPAGMLTHPASYKRTGTLMNAVSYYLNHSNSGTFIRPGLVHRIDKETSGIVVIAKNLKTHRAICKSFENKRVEKRYLALLQGRLKAKSGTIVAPIGRYEARKQWDVKPDGGKYAETRYKIARRFSEATLVEFEPVTGRTNQLRIHAAHSGHPIIGDEGRGGREFGRLCLHAAKMTLPHPKTKTLITLKAEEDPFDLSGFSPI